MPAPGDDPLATPYWTRRRSTASWRWTIVTLLRAYQRDPALFDLPPGTPDVPLP